MKLRTRARRVRRALPPKVTKPSQNADAPLCYAVFEAGHALKVELIETRDEGTHDPARAHNHNFAHP